MFPYGSPDLRRLRAGRYRVFYTIAGQPAQEYVSKGLDESVRADVTDAIDMCPTRSIRQRATDDR
jgi:ferredoxin